jgi:catalase
MINHALFVRREPKPRKEREVALGSCARRLAKSLMCVSLLLASAAATADNPPVTTQVVDLANKLSGVHPGFRAFHAKGVVVEGSFKASSEAARLSGAPLFSGRAIPVTVRFSDGNGMPNVADGSPAANPHGMAIRYHLPGGVNTDMVTNSLKFFPVGTGEDFRDLLLAIVASPPDAPKPTKLEQFFASHPNAPKAFGTAATPEQAAKQPPDFLSDELTQRIARKPVVFRLKAQLAEPGDQTKDASQPWPDDRKVVELGVLMLNKVVPNSLKAEKKLLFLPTSLTAGIELSDDPLPSVRAAAYAVSFGRRSQPSSASSGPDNMNGHTSDTATQPSTVSP